MPPKDRAITVYLKPLLHKRVSIYLNVKGVSGSQLVQMALQEFILKHEPEMLRLSIDYRNAVNNLPPLVSHSELQKFLEEGE